MTNKDKNKKNSENGQKIEKAQQERKSFMTVLENMNRILIDHKDKEEIRVYRRFFYGLFFVFTLLFLLGILGLRNIQQGYYAQITLLEKGHEKQIEQLKFQLNTQLAQEKYLMRIDNVDLESDDAITKYVDPNISFNNPGYIPSDLVPVAGEHITDSKQGSILVHKIAKEQFDKLAEQFYNETQQKIVVVSGYRSYAYQKGIKERGCPDNLCAKAGHSEHQSGYAIDLYSASTQAEWLGNNTLRKYFDWLNANAHVYGFHNPYRKGVDIDGYEPEPWHWRYVGEDLARYLKQNDLTFAEFYYTKQETK